MIISQKIPSVVFTLGVFIFVFGLINIFLPYILINFFPQANHQFYQQNIYIFIIICFALIALAMHYSTEGKGGNAWDVWFFTVPGVVVTLLIVGILGEAHFSEVWKWVAIALGALVGLESISSVLRTFLEKNQTSKKPEPEVETKEIQQK